MSQKFGLDWKKHEARRMMAFVHILYEEDAARSSKASEPKQKFRKRL